MRKRMPFYDVYLHIKHYLHMSYTFKLKSSFGNQKCTLKNIKSALFLFSAPCPFFSLRETLCNIMVLCVISMYQWLGMTIYIYCDSEYFKRVTNDNGMLLMFPCKYNIHA